MFRKIKKVVASTVLACSVFSLTAFHSTSVSAIWGPVAIGIHAGIYVATRTAAGAVDDVVDDIILNTINPALFGRRS